MLAHVFCDDTQADTCEVVDSEAGVLGIVHWEHAVTAPLNLVVLEAFGGHLQAHGFRYFVKHDLDEDTAT